MDAIKQAVDSGAQVVFPNALIAGDVVMTHLISRLGLFEKIPVLFVNTLHLFEETLDFIDVIEKEYKF
jgi:3'-phosphoadenosine 5'-phosphosulfate sulfotransferase (PAPS reductase)/FAD synthetase